MNGTVIDEGNLYNYRTEIPNLIDDWGLSPYAFRLYVHLKRVAGPSGACYQGTRLLAKACNMSIGKITSAKRELALAGLIIVAAKDTSHGPVDDITIVSVWPENFQTYSPKDGKEAERVENVKRSLSEHPRTSSSRELISSRSEHLRSRREQKKQPIKNQPNEEIEDSPQPAIAVAPVPDLNPINFIGDNQDRNTFKGKLLQPVQKTPAAAVVSEPPPTAPPGFTWYLTSASDARLHLVADGKSRPLCHFTPWQYPRRASLPFELRCPTCPDCLRIAAERTVPKPIKPKMPSPAAQLLDRFFEGFGTVDLPLKPDYSPLIQFATTLSRDETPPEQLFAAGQLYGVWWRAVGEPVLTWEAGETTTAIRLALGLARKDTTTEHITRHARKLRGDPFWADKFISFSKVAKEVSSHGESSRAVLDGRSEADSAAADEYFRRRTVPAVR